MSKKAFIQILFATSALVICAYFTRDTFGVSFAGVAICLTLFCVLSLIVLVCKRKKVGEGYIAAKEISAFKMYDKMQFFAKGAFYIAALGFFNTVLIDAELTFTDTVFYLLAVLGSGLISLVIIYFAFAKKVAQKFDRTNVFALGTAIWLVSAYLLYRRVFDITAIGYIFNCVGLGLMYASLKFMSGDIKDAMTLVDVDSQSFAKFSSYMDAKAHLFAYVTLAVLCIIFAVIPSISHLFWLVTLLLPSGLFVVACVFALFQPLDGRNLDKLVVYRANDGAGDAIKYSLVDNLTKEKSRIGLRIMIWFVRPWFPSKCVGKEKLKNLDAPIIFVGNHYEIYGPIVSVLRMPVHFRPWVIWQMLDGEQIEQQMQSGIDKTFKFLPKCIRGKLPKIAKRFVLYVLEGMRPIPVYKQNLRQVVQTIHLTVQAMEEGDNVMLFPESAYSDGGVDSFYTGFAEVGNAYFKKTGKCAVFVPVYISKKHRKLYIGDGIAYNANNNKAEEKRRVAAELRNAMLRMAEESNKKKDGKNK